MSAGNRKFRQKPKPPPSYFAEQKHRGRAATLLAHKRRMLAEYPYCHGCCTPLTESTATIDHLLPISAGGTDAPSNLTIMCEACNRRKGGDGADWRTFNKMAKARRQKARRAGKIPPRPQKDAGWNT